MYLSHTSAGISSAASTSLPRHSSPGQDPRASLSGPGASSPAPPTTTSTSGSFITLAVPSSIAPIMVILAGNLLYAGAVHRCSLFLYYDPDVSGHMGLTEGRKISRANKQGKGKLCSHFLSFIFLGLSHPQCPEITLGMNALASSVSFCSPESWIG